jgi:excinuclease ABC subunit B
LTKNEVELHGVTPRTVIRSISDSLATVANADYFDEEFAESAEVFDFADQAALDVHILKLENEMRDAAKKFEFEKAAKLRDQVKELRTKEFLFR